MGLVDLDIRLWMASSGTRLAVKILGDRRPAVVLAEPPFDPENQRPRS